MVRVIGPRDPRPQDAPLVNTTSKSQEPWSRGLSPFFLGPVPINGHTSLNMENAWQFSKVYAHQVDENGDPSESWWRWARTGWSQSWAERYPMGRGARPLYSYLDGEKLEYVEARKRIYIPLYAVVVRQSSVWPMLRTWYEREGKITLFDFDGYDHRALGMSYEDVVNSETRKMGHGFVLAMMLEGVL